MIVVVVVQNKGITMAAIKEHVSNTKNGIPSFPSSLHEDDYQEEEEVHTFQDPNFYDYIKLPNFTKKTGIEVDDFHSFALKELLDNAADFLEVYYKGTESDNNNNNNATPIIRVYISNNTETTGLFRIAVINPNDKDIPVLPISNLKKTYNYLGAFSSKSNQNRITRGAQGVALKQLGTLAYMQYGKNWNEPIIFQHNGRIDKVYIDVDRKRGRIIPRFENGETLADNTDTKIVFTLPAISVTKNYKRLIEYCKEYTLYNTHIGYEFYFDDDDTFTGAPSIELHTQHPISQDFKNLIASTVMVI